MKILFLGTPLSAVPILQTLIDSHHIVVGVVSQPPNKKGRGQDFLDSDVAKFANDKQIQVFTPEKISSSYFDEKLLALQADIAIVVAYGQILPEDLLARLKYGWLNIHFSLLPKYRGAAPVQRQIIQGDRNCGVTFFKIDTGLDTGNIFAQYEYLLTEDINYEKALEDLTAVASKNIVNIVDKIESNSIQSKIQSGSPSYAHKIVEEDFRIQWVNDTFEIRNLVNAGSKNLSAWTIFKGNKIKIKSVQIPAADISLPFGAIKVVEKNVLVGCNDGIIILDQIVPEGKKQMDAFSWMNGIQDKNDLKFS